MKMNKEFHACDSESYIDLYRNKKNINKLNISNT